MSSFRSRKHIKEEYGQTAVSNTKFSSVTLNELAVERQRKKSVISDFNKATNNNTDINPNGVKTRTVRGSDYSPL